MKNTYLIILLFSFTILSCQKKEKAFNDKLLGTWLHVAIIPHSSSTIPPLYLGPPVGMTFDSNLIIEHHTGFFTKIESWNDRLKRKYLGNFTTYHSDNDSIYILHLSDSMLRSISYSFQGNDTLMHHHKNSSWVYKRIQYSPISEIQFDRVFISFWENRSPYSTWSSIDSNGILYYDDYKTPDQSLLKAKINNDQLKYFFDKYKSVDINTLEDSWSNEAPIDSPLITTTFLLDGRIIKIVEDHAFSGNAQLGWANLTLKNCLANMEFDTLHEFRLPQNEEPVIEFFRSYWNK